MESSLVENESKMYPQMEVESSTIKMAINTKGKQIMALRKEMLMKENEVKMFIKAMESQKIIMEINMKDIEQTEHSKNKEFNHIQMAVFMMENKTKVKEKVTGSLNTKMETDKKENELMELNKEMGRIDSQILKILQANGLKKIFQNEMAFLLILMMINLWANEQIE